MKKKCTCYKSHPTLTEQILGTVHLCGKQWSITTSTNADVFAISHKAQARKAGLASAKKRWGFDPAPKEKEEVG